VDHGISGCCFIRKGIMERFSAHDLNCLSYGRVLLLGLTRPIKSHCPEKEGELMEFLDRVEL